MYSFRSCCELSIHAGRLNIRNYYNHPGLQDHQKLLGRNALFVRNALNRTQEQNETYCILHTSPISCKSDTDFMGNETRNVCKDTWCRMQYEIWTQRKKIMLSSLQLLLPLLWHVFCRLLFWH